MNAITKAIEEIKWTIPVEVLNLAFRERSTRISQVISLDERITHSILRKKVLVDANLVGGIATNVDLSFCAIKYLNNGEFIIEVPKSILNGKLIITPLSLVSNVMYSNTAPSGSMSPVISSGLTMMDNLGTVDVIETSKLELIGENIILVQDPTAMLSTGVLRCVVENSSNLENINPRSYLQFSKLCILATKAYIYNTTRVKLDQGFIYGGHELGVVTEFVEKYADAQELYEEFLNTTWRKVAFINNSDSMSRYIVSMIGNNL